MTKREKVFVILLAFVILIVGYYYLFLSNQLDEIEDLNIEISANEAEIQAYKRAEARVIKLNKEKEEIEENLSLYFRPFLRNIDQEEIILLINEILVRSDVVVGGLTFEDFDTADYISLNSDALTTTIGFEGNYKDVMSLVSSFWRFDHNIYVKNLSLTESEDRLTGSMDIGFVRVNNKYASDVTLFEWYNDVYYLKEDPFAEDFSYLFNPNYFYTGTDVAFYNEAFEGFEDIFDHWAEEVINFFGRNGYLVADELDNIRPDEPMTRLETVLLLDLVFRWELQDNFIELESFDDYDVIADLSDIEKKSLLKAYNSGYIFGYEDNTLRPYSNITYEELGYLGDNLINNVNVTWNDVAEEISTLFAYQSVGITEPNLPATRAEIIYFLSYINDGLID